MITRTHITLATLALLTTMTLPATAQEMTFDVEDTAFKTTVVLTDVSNIKFANAKKIVGQIEDIVRDFGGFSVVGAKTLRGQMGRRGYKQMGRCDKPECYLKAVSKTSVTRLILVAVDVTDGIITVEMEIDDVPTQEALNFAVAVTDDLSDPNYLSGPVGELLSLQEPSRPTQVRDPAAFDPNTREEDDEDDGEPLVFDPIWTYSAVGVGIGMIALGGFFGLQADEAQAQIQESPHSREDLQALIDDGESFQSYANVAFGVGLAALATGAVFWYFGPEEGSPGAASSSGSPTPGITVDIGPTGARVQIPY